jgi:probable addiction module antidote protein
VRNKTESYSEWLHGKLTDPKRAANYLNAAAEDSSEAFLVAMRDVAEAHKMSKVALGAEANRESLYKTLSVNGNPLHETLRNILRVCGLRFTVAPDNKIRLVTRRPRKIVRPATRTRVVARARRK